MRPVTRADADCPPVRTRRRRLLYRRMIYADSHPAASVNRPAAVLVPKKITGQRPGGFLGDLEKIHAPAPRSKAMAAQTPDFGPPAARTIDGYTSRVSLIYAV